MSGDLEAAGALATAGLAAGALEGCEPAEGHPGVCANCGAKVERRFCAECGQATHVHRTLGHFFEEALHGVLHFDTKAWRTLPLLAFRPGTLTREYITGKRAKYVSPLALFLFTVFLMFAALALTNGGVSMADVIHTEVNGQDMSRTDQREAAIADLRAQRAEAVAAGADDRVRVLDQTIALAEASASRGGGLVTLGHILAERIEAGEIVINTGDAHRDAKIREKLLNPELLIYKIEQATYKFAFLLIPISLPFIALLFLWKRGVTLYDHTVFALYSLSFMSLFYLGLVFVTKATGDWLPAQIVRSFAAMFVPPVHMFFHLGGTYGLGLFSALWRTLALLVLCGISFLIFWAIILGVTLLT